MQTPATRWLLAFGAPVSNIRLDLRHASVAQMVSKYLKRTFCHALYFRSPPLCLITRLVARTLELGRSATSCSCFSNPVPFEGPAHQHNVISASAVSPGSAICCYLCSSEFCLIAHVSLCLHFFWFTHLQFPDLLCLFDALPLLHSYPSPSFGLSLRLSLTNPSLTPSFPSSISSSWYFLC